MTKSKMSGVGIIEDFFVAKQERENLEQEAIKDRNHIIELFTKDERRGEEMCTLLVGLFAQVDELKKELEKVQKEIEELKESRTFGIREY